MVAQAHRFKKQIRYTMDRPAELVHEYPVSSMLVLFGVGMGVGLIVGQALSGAFNEILEEPTMTERMKRQVYDAMSHVLPPSLLKQLSSCTAS